MKKRSLYLTWGLLYALCAALSLIPSPQGVLAGLMVTVSLLFFVPPAMLLYWAIPRERFETVRLIRNLSIASLALTMAVLVANFLSYGASAAAGDVLYILLILVSVPMVCVQAWAVSLFLWACLLMVCFRYGKSAKA